MNFLAHAYLSFRHPQILVGNMVSDFVKGAAKNNFEKDVRQGIQLHREIDAFTDRHPATRKAKEIFRPHYRLYSGALMDIIYDHYLARDSRVFTEESLKQFTSGVYAILEKHSGRLPPVFVHVLYYMKTEDWLYHYRYEEGIRKTLKGLVRRASFLKESDTAYQLFIDHHSYLQECYDDFFPDVKQFANKRFHELLA